MVPIIGTQVCIDQYEVSPGEGCPFQAPTTLTESIANQSAARCAPESKPDKTPWVYVNQTLAAELCARAGKRLPTGTEWFKAALGTPASADACAHGGVMRTGSNTTCVSGSGAFDMVSNVWEWTDENVRNGTLGAVTLPDAGYIDNADTQGVPITTGAEPNVGYGNDRLWIDTAIVAGVMRGGYFNSDDDGGIYALFAASPPSFSGNAVGFRCVR
jgi:formylglycine-generating enzyme required for sulfatase activity